MGQCVKWLLGAGKGRRQVRVMFTSAGRRIELIEAFTRAAKSLGLQPVWHTTDAERDIAAGCIADHTHHVPKIASRDYIPTLLRIVRREKIDLLVPLIDSDLLKLAQARDDFTRAKCGALISSEKVIRTCRDKMRMFKFLTEHGIDTPRTWTAEELSNRRCHRFPYFLKPKFGSASKGNFIVRDVETLKAFAPRIPNVIVQEFVKGIEHTLDVYTGYDGRPRCVVPRVRIEVRGGEVTKARTVKHMGIMKTGLRVAETLGECVGLITIQLILTPDGRIRVIEVNPRFGGGVPLAIQAGANFPKWLLAEWLGHKPRIRLDHFQDGLLMLRYHQSFFLKAGQKPR